MWMHDFWLFKNLIRSNGEGRSHEYKICYFCRLFIITIFLFILHIKHIRDLK